MNHVFIIAEIGSNYDGDLSKAKEYISAVKACGADAVKFQTLKKEKLVAPFIWTEGKKEENPVYRNFCNLELSDEDHYELKKTADKEGIEFISTPFYLEAVDLLEKVGVKAYKIAAGDITFKPLLKKIGKTKKKVILSTGASSLQDVKKAVDILRGEGCHDIVLLHCVSQYPPKFEEMNLKALETLKKVFGYPVGISDHTEGNLVPIASVALGGTYIEKHVTFDRNLKGPDHSFSMTIDEFKDMVKQIRILEKALGNGEKKPSASELIKQHRMRRGVYGPQDFMPRDNSEGLWLRSEYKK